ncbi:G5 domain-containing protein [Candidatus Berkelbacteria bacterium]|nr:G5 domain-containing protein [Candidatus Berkelbacteria bacterium]
MQRLTRASIVRHLLLLVIILASGFAVKQFSLADSSVPVEKTSEAEIRGLTVRRMNEVDHLVERYMGAPGYFTLIDQLKALDVTLYPEDHFTAIPDPSLGIGSTIEVIRSTTVTVIDGKEIREYRTWAPTVADLLAEIDLALDSDDRLEPDQWTSLKNDSVVAITRIGVSEELETEPIVYKTIRKQDNEFEKGKTRVEHKGRDGLKKKIFTVKRENDEIVNRELARVEIARESEDEVIIEGTKIISYGTGQATWYSLRSGLQAAHNNLPFGAHVRVTNVANGKSVDVIITDRGIQGGALIDLTADAFALIAPLSVGRIQVRLEKDYD